MSIQHWRRFLLEEGGSGGEIETPKASRGRGIGRGCPPPSRLGGLGSVVSSPSGVRGPKQVLVHSELERTHVVTTNLVFLKFMFCDTQKTSVSLQAPPHEPVVGLLEQASKQLYSPK